MNDEFHRTRPDGSIWMPNQMWELDPPPCEVYGCGKSSLPLCTPDANGIKCLECKTFHRICVNHVNSLLGLGFVFKFRQGDLVEVVCPNEAMIGHVMTQ